VLKVKRAPRFVDQQLLQSRFLHRTFDAEVRQRACGDRTDPDDRRSALLSYCHAQHFMPSNDPGQALVQHVSVQFAVDPDSQDDNGYRASRIPLILQPETLLGKREHRRLVGSANRNQLLFPALGPAGRKATFQRGSLITGQGRDTGGDIRLVGVIHRDRP
jgi:hypothetical protein